MIQNYSILGTGVFLAQKEIEQNGLKMGQIRGFSSLFMLEI